MLLQRWGCCACCADGQESGRRGAVAIVLMLHSMLRMSQVGYCNDGSFYWGCAGCHRVQQVRLLLR